MQGHIGAANLMETSNERTAACEATACLNVSTDERLNPSRNHAANIGLSEYSARSTTTGSYILACSHSLDTTSSFMSVYCCIY